MENIMEKKNNIKTVSNIFFPFHNDCHPIVCCSSRFPCFCVLEVYLGIDRLMKKKSNNQMYVFEVGNTQKYSAQKMDTYKFCIYMPYLYRICININE